MDVIAKRTMWRTLAAIAPGRSLLLTTHSMEEADAIATRAAILSRRLLAVGTTHALRAAHSAHYRVTLVLATAPLSRPDESHALEAWVMRELSGHGAVLEADSLGGQVKFTVPMSSGHSGQGGAAGRGTEMGRGSEEPAVAGGAIMAIIEMLEAHKAELGVAYYSVGGASLEHVFMSVVKESHVLEEDEKVRRGRWRL
jgi:ATP-binding cassette, subfamily A (ABC1), member 3